jgi:predicted AAA+ superfamily ATPase
VRESLAGRAFVYDLWPLMASELRAGPEAPLQTPLLDQLATLPRIGSRLQQEPEVCLGPDEEEPRAALDHLSLWGGMPGLLWLDEVERRDWLRSYQQTFLERDLADLARLSDLVPFRTFQQLAMLRTGQVLSFAGLGRDAGLSASTARRYLEYLRLSYQVVLLPPFARNLTSSITKTPKLYWTDLGILRSATQRWGPLDGPLFETLVVSEVTKWLATMARDVRATFYRTRAGMEVDLVLSTAEGELGIEVKLATSVGPSEARSLRAFAAAAGDRWRGGLVVYRGAHLQPLDEGLDVWAMPVHRLLG